MELTVQIVQFVSDEPQPGIVACEFVDALGQKHKFIDKVPGFTAELLDARSRDPKAGSIRCMRLASWRDENGRDLVRITTEFPDYIESSNGRVEFVVFPTQSPVSAESAQ